MKTIAILRTTIEVSEKVSPERIKEFVRQSIEAERMRLEKSGTPGDQDKMAYITDVKISLIEDRRIYQHD